jgi:hypothetical protein
MIARARARRYRDVIATLSRRKGKKGERKETREKEEKKRKVEYHSLRHADRALTAQSA